MATGAAFKEGDLIITNIRVVFVYGDSTEPIVFVWTNILDIKYAKGRPIIGIKTVITQFDDILIHLSGRQLFDSSYCKVHRFLLADRRC